MAVTATDLYAWRYDCSDPLTRDVYALEKYPQNMANIMGGVVKSMAIMNKQMDLPSMQKVIMEYEKQSEMMGMTQEM